MNPIIEVMTAYRDNIPVDITDIYVSAIVTKLVRRGWLSKSVVTGVVTMNDYGAEKLKRISLS